MKTPTIILTAAALLVLGATQASAHSTRTQATKVVTVAMHDPGCHWFFTAGTFRKTMTARGPVALLNQDEAALKVVGSTGAKRDPVGKRILLGRGVYTITMVGQAPDDNTLKLVVN
jgi:acyl-coenzyme A synthetase/AMP-(fatty) acid ligase